MRIAAVVPAFNESHSIKNVVEELIATGMKSGIQITPVVVNDCSTDDTGNIIDHLPCVALHLPINLGIGGAVQTGFRFALENNFDYACQVDGDGQHPADQIPAMVKAAQENNWDVVIGSRFLRKEGFQSSSIRRAGINHFSRLNKWLTGQKIYDTTSGFRLLGKKALEFVYENYPDEYPEPESLVMYAGKKLRVGEIPVQMRERQGGVSSINSVRAIYYMWKVSLGCVFSAIRK
ncbi:MAG TPA: glycosyltransferase family 2 protein [Bacteroidia bacterium]|jgi:glycosyltransferase involved in cell wall biosynthesis|nr:glycosyltransferase family 2 protein [Bacteroidia bacterium]